MKILIAGTFDIIHPGHIHFIQEAAELGEVHVILACNDNCRKRGKTPIFSEEERREIVKGIKGVVEAYIGRTDNDEMAMINLVRPDIILIGPDQDYPIEKLQTKLAAHSDTDKIQIIKSKNYYNKYPLHSSSLIKIKIFQRL